MLSMMEPLKVTSSFLTDVIFLVHSQEAWLMLCLLMTVEVFADQEMFSEIMVPWKVKVWTHSMGIPFMNSAD